MLYVKQITTAAGTTEASPQRTTINAWRGIVTNIKVRFPPGPEFLLHCKIFAGGEQIMPVAAYDDIVGDDEAIIGDLYKELKSGWNKISVETWNEDDTYSHDLVVLITILPASVALPYAALATIAGQLRQLMRRIGLLPE